jgi:hypothetical protein
MGKCKNKFVNQRETTYNFAPVFLHQKIIVSNGNEKNFST